MLFRSEGGGTLASEHDQEISFQAPATPGLVRLRATVRQRDVTCAAEALITVTDSLVPATVFRKKGAALVAIASWATQDTTVTLTIDWARLGIDSAHATIEAPGIKNFQPARHFAPGDAIPVEKGKGWLLVIRQ